MLIASAGFIDKSAVAGAKSYAKANDFFFHDRIKYVELDWSNDSAEIQACEFTYFWKFWGHQTCFVRHFKGASSKVKGQNFIFVYTRPGRKFSISMDGFEGTKPDHLRFTKPFYSLTGFGISPGRSVIVHGEALELDDYQVYLETFSLRVSNWQPYQTSSELILL